MIRELLDGLVSFIGLKGGNRNWKYDERRELVRLRCKYEVIGKTLTGKKFKGYIIDMGLKGMKLHTFEQLRKGETVDITYPVPILEVPKDTVRCTVQWSRTRPRDYVIFAGLLYSEDDRQMSKSWVKYLLRQLGFSKSNIYQKRKYARAECFVPAQILGSSGSKVKGTLFNLGVGGALVEAAAPLDVGEEVELTIGPYESLSQFAISGKLVNRQSEAKRYLHGIEFPHLTSYHLRNLEKYLFHLLRQQWTE